jgi:hypothetical protein
MVMMESAYECIDERNNETQGMVVGGELVMSPSDLKRKI